MQASKPLILHSSKDPPFYWRMDLSDYEEHGFIHMYSSTLGRYVLPRQIIESMFDLPLRVVAIILGISDSAMNSIEHAVVWKKFGTLWPYSMLKPDHRAWFIQRRLFLLGQLYDSDSSLDLKSAAFVASQHVTIRYKYDLTHVFRKHEQILMFAQNKCVRYAEQHVWQMSVDWQLKTKTFLRDFKMKLALEVCEARNPINKAEAMAPEPESLFWKYDEAMLMAGICSDDCDWSLPAGVKESEWFSQS